MNAPIAKKKKKKKKKKKRVLRNNRNLQVRLYYLHIHVLGSVHYLWPAGRGGEGGGGHFLAHFEGGGAFF